ncbi:MAG TPA: hypothetical protein VND19_04395 [Acetobacteraceae bacterium]|nr:hypothetical protein [Acetobacteraceae bacterium]
MTVPDAPQPADPAPDAPEQAAPPLPQPRPARNVLPWLCGLGFLVLASAIGFVGWWSQQLRPATDLQPLENRVARLEQRPPGPVDLGPLTARVTALEQRAAPDLAPLETRVAALEKQIANDSRFAARLDALSARVDALSGHDQSTKSGLIGRLDADEARLTTVEHAIAQVTAAAQQAARLARIQAAEAALSAGQPLGDLPNAPPAVAHFAAANPPTEASLRLAFPRAETAALAASRPDMGGKPFLARVLAHAEDLVTVRQGDRVLLGDPAAGVLARARTALEAGDLAGAVAAASSLSGPAAAAMAAWLADARALLAARAGLAAMAAHA